MNINETLLDYHENRSNPDDHLASTGARFANYIIDRIGTYAFMLLIVAVSDQSLFLNGSVPGLDIVILIFATIGYWVVFETLFGKTPGKFLTGTKVVTVNGEQPTFLNILGRTLCRFIPFEPFSFLGSEPVGWHDSISGTRVVKDTFQRRENNYV